MSADHRDHRHSDRVGSFLRAYYVEIIAAASVALGLFLLLERMNIRSILFRWASIGTQSALRALGQLDDAMAQSIAKLTLSNALGLVLVIVAILAVALRARARLARTAVQTVLCCPLCGGSIHRVHRRWGDRVVSWLVPVRRYRCSNRECRWCGIRVAASKHGADPAAPVR